MKTQIENEERKKRSRRNKVKDIIAELSRNVSDVSRYPGCYEDNYRRPAPCTKTYFLDIAIDRIEELFAKDR